MTSSFSRSLPCRCAAASLLVVAAAAVLAAQRAEWQVIPGYEGQAYPAAAYDPGRQRVVQFGGRNGGFMDGFDDTWEWDGARWQHVWTASAPSPRRASAMAYDPVRKTVLLFGGRTGKQQLGETWEWDGRVWRQLAPPVAPSPRSGHAMVTDSRRGRILLFGGWTDSPQNAFGKASDETWEWDGQRWTLLSPATRPWPRWGHAMGQDPSSGDIILVGGGNPFPIKEPSQWHWNGTDWRQVTPPELAPQHSGAHIAAVGNGLVLHGKYSVPLGPDYAWTWDGRTWTEVKTPVTPGIAGAEAFVTEPGGRSAISVGRGQTWRWDGKAWTVVSDQGVPRGHTVMAYDGSRDQILIVESDAITQRIVTWALRGDRFVRLDPPRSPRYRSFSVGAGMQYHAGLDRVLLQINREDWSWDGKQWTLLSANTSGRLFQQSSYDPHRQKIVVASPKSELIFEWDANGWVWRTVTGGPAVIRHSQAYDIERRQLVVFGGLKNGSPTDETWEWDGVRWRQHQPVHRPAARRQAQLIYDPVLGGTVLFGGVAGRSTFGDTWLWDGRDWRQLAAGKLPSRSLSSNFAMRNAVYDAGRRRIVGRFDPLEQLYPRTWELVVPTLTTPQRYPQLGESIDLDVGLPGSAGRPFALVLSGSGWPGIPLRSVPWIGTERLPIAADALLGATAQLGLGGTLDGLGRLRVSIPVPNNPWLWWTELHAAGVSLSPSGLGEITNPQEIRIIR